MSRELLDTAEHLLTRPDGVTPADACRAISTIYYALFHFLARDCCVVLLGDPSSPTPPPMRAWNHLYRSLSHTILDEKCRNSNVLKQKNFPPEVVEIASFIQQMQCKREKCDYGYAINPKTGSIPVDIAFARDHMRKYEALDVKHRKAFAVYILFRDNRAEKKLIDV